MNLNDDFYYDIYKSGHILRINRWQIFDTRFSRVILI
jgi:hypothetical protein